MNLNYWLEIFFSAGIATFGLVLNSPAVIIGAMLISPLIGPIMAAGLSLAIGDLYLGIKAIANLVISVATAVGLSAVFVWLLPFHSATAEILSRTNPNLLDLAIAILSGLAGSVLVCRGAGTGDVTALPGVAIAVALMPPLCVMGFGLGSGANLPIVGGAGLLFLANLVAIVASAFAVFLLVGMNSPNGRAEIKRSREEEVFAHKLARVPFARFLSSSGRLRWRILMIVVLLGCIAVPLRRALVQLTNEALARRVVDKVVKRLVPASSLVSQSVQVGRTHIVIRLVCTASIPDVKVNQAEQSIGNRTGKDVDISVEEVASNTELTGLMDRLTAPAPAPPPARPKTVDQIQRDLLARIGPALNQSWPPEDPLQTFAVDIDPTGIVLNVQYQGTADLGVIATNMVLRRLQGILGTRNLSLNLRRISSPAPVQSSKTAR